MSLNKIEEEIQRIRSEFYNGSINVLKTIAEELKKITPDINEVVVEIDDSTPEYSTYTEVKLANGEVIDSVDVRYKYGEEPERLLDKITDIVVGLSKLFTEIDRKIVDKPVTIRVRYIDDIEEE